MRGFQPAVLGKCQEKFSGMWILKAEAGGHGVEVGGGGIPARNFTRETQDLGLLVSP